MPLYDYHCPVCDHEFEALQKATDEPLKQCPRCREQSLRKKLTAGNFRLSGGGVYSPSVTKFD